MNNFAITVLVLWVTLFVLGGAVYLAGRFLRLPRLKKVGEDILVMWLLVDLILIILIIAASGLDWPQ